MIFSKVIFLFAMNSFQTIQPSLKGYDTTNNYILFYDIDTLNKRIVFELEAINKPIYMDTTFDVGLSKDSNNQFKIYVNNINFFSSFNYPVFAYKITPKEKVTFIVSYGKSELKSKNYWVSQKYIVSNPIGIIVQLYYLNDLKRLKHKKLKNGIEIMNNLYDYKRKELLIINHF